MMTGVDTSVPQRHTRYSLESISVLTTQRRRDCVISMSSMLINTYLAGGWSVFVWGSLKCVEACAFLSVRAGRLWGFPYAFGGLTLDHMNRSSWSEYREYGVPKLKVCVRNSLVENGLNKYIHGPTKQFILSAVFFVIFQLSNSCVIIDKEIRSPVCCSWLNCWR